MCKVSPCLSTPDDVFKLMLAGYSDKLSRTGVFNEVTGKMVEIVALKGTPWRMPGMKHDLMSCVMQDNNGLCKLHTLGLKPTEGKLMPCGAPHEVSVKIRDQILKSWEGFE